MKKQNLICFCLPCPPQPATDNPSFLLRFDEDLSVLPLCFIRGNQANPRRHVLFFD